MERPAQFLRFLVQSALRKETHLLKESVLGVEIFDRPASWDPRLDPVVRQEAARLRKRLARYYEQEAPNADLRIEVPVGTYVPEFVKSSSAAQPETPLEQEEIRPRAISGNRARWATALVVLAAMAGSIWTYNRIKSPVARASPREAKAADSKAEELYLRGVYYWQKRTPESLQQALDFFTQSIVQNPNYALAYVGMADCYNLLREFAAMPEQEAYPRALAATRKALELDDSSAEAHASLAFISFWWNWNAAAAEREYRRAISLNPNYSTAHHWYATFLSTRMRHPEAIEQIEIAQKLDPSSAAILTDKGLLLYLGGRKQEALTLLRQLEMDRGALPSAHRYLARICLRERDYTDYVAELKNIAADSKSESDVAVARAAEEGFAAGGAQAMLEEIMATEIRQHSRGLVSSYTLAQSYARAGRNAEAIRYLEEASKVRSSIFLEYRHDEAFDQLRDDPSYTRLDDSLEPRIGAGTLPEAP